MAQNSSVRRPFELKAPTDIPQRGLSSRTREVTGGAEGKGGGRERQGAQRAAEEDLSGTKRQPSVLRPPTPEPDEDSDQEHLPEVAKPKPKALSVKELVEIKFVTSGKKERLKELLKRRLLDCGWQDKLRVECRAFIKKVGRDNVSTNDVVRFVTPKGRASVPGPVKAELLQQIQSFLQP